MRARLWLIFRPQALAIAFIANSEELSDKRRAEITNF